jgi:hypothetical protein
MSSACSLTFGAVGGLAASGHNEDVARRKAEGEDVKGQEHSVGKRVLAFGAVGLAFDALLIVVAISALPTTITGPVGGDL